MDEAFIKRILPHSAEAEQSVIGSMIMDRDAIIAASEIITGTDFYENQYSILFDTKVELFNEGKPVDLVTLQNRLREKDVPPQVCSLEFIRDLVTSVPTSANVRYPVCCNTLPSIFAWFLSSATLLFIVLSS
jgi:replicative DNA helicase